MHLKVFYLCLIFGSTCGINLVNACNFYCYNCSDCIEKINFALPGQTICLNTSISNHKGTCINNPLNFNNKIFDCQKNIIDGDNSGIDYGIYLSRKSGNIIKNCIVMDFHYGIYLDYSSNNTLTNNAMNNNQNSGIFLWFSPNNTLINNTMNNNTYNFNIYGDFYQNIDTSNIVNGKYVYYWTNEKNAPNNCRNLEINESHNAGFVALISCENITVKNLNLTNNSHGILLVNTSNSKILNNTANNNLCGIYLWLSSNNTLANNTANNNTEGVKIVKWGRIIWCGYGISLGDSSNNTLTNNIANKNHHFGVFFMNSSNNTLINSALSNNYRGIWLVYSSNNILINNTLTNNKHGICLDSSSNNILTHHIADNSENGIFLRYSSNNTITNNIANNNKHGFYLWGSSNNTLTNNIANNNGYGIYIFYNSNFNGILDNTVTNNKENGIAITNCTSGWCVKGNINNTIRGNKILNNTIGIFSQNSTSIINNNYVCGNTQDFNSLNWLSSVGDNNYCDNAGKWNDTNAEGCKNTCKAKDIFDLVEMLEHLNNGMGITDLKFLYWDLDNNYNVNLFDAFALIQQLLF